MVLLHPPVPLWQSISERRSYTGSPRIILGLPHLQHPYGRVSRYAGVTLAALGLSWTTFPHSTLVAEYPGTPELHWQSWDYPGTISFPTTPVAEYPSAPWKLGISPQL